MHVRHKGGRHGTILSTPLTSKSVRKFYDTFSDDSSMAEVSRRRNCVFNTRPTYII
jgi:hypothetical protein